MRRAVVSSSGVSCGSDQWLATNAVLTRLDTIRTRLDTNLTRLDTIRCRFYREGSESKRPSVSASFCDPRCPSQASLFHPSSCSSLPSQPIGPSVNPVQALLLLSLVPFYAATTRTRLIQTRGGLTSRELRLLCSRCFVRTIWLTNASLRRITWLLSARERALRAICPLLFWPRARKVQTTRARALSDQVLSLEGATRARSFSWYEDTHANDWYLNIKRHFSS